MLELIKPEDLAPFASISQEKAAAMIQDATATALRVAPCLKNTNDDDVLDAARALLRGAILRWNEAGTGEVTNKVSGPFTTTYVQQSRKSLFWPSEISDLQALCAESAGDDQAFSVDMIGDASIATSSLADRPDLWLQWAHPAPSGTP